MRARSASVSGALAVAVVGLAGGLLSATAVADVHATIGTNAVSMPERSTAFVLRFDGTATRVSATPAPPLGVVSPTGRYRVEVGDRGIVLVDSRTGARRALAPASYRAAAYWSARGELAYTTGQGGIERLVVFDPRTGLRRRVATRVCGSGVDPWSPDGGSLAIAVSLPHHGCDGDGLVGVGVSDARTGRMRRITAPRSAPIAWTRDGRSLLIEQGGSSGPGTVSLVDPATGKGPVVLSHYTGLAPSGMWSSDHRFFAIVAIEGAGEVMLVLDGTLRRRVAELPYGQQYAWAPHRPMLAVATTADIRIFDASRRRVVTTVPVRAPYGFSTDSLAWAPDERSVTVVAAPGLGHD